MKKILKAICTILAVSVFFGLALFNAPKVYAADPLAQIREARMSDGSLFVWTEIPCSSNAYETHTLKSGVLRVTIRYRETEMQFCDGPTKNVYFTLDFRHAIVNKTYINGILFPIKKFK